MQCSAEGVGGGGGRRPPWPTPLPPSSRPRPLPRWLQAPLLGGRLLPLGIAGQTNRFLSSSSCSDHEAERSFKLSGGEGERQVQSNILFFFVLESKV